jgi:c-di-GMP-binding flagellar brake protein YcgR
VKYDGNLRGTGKYKEILKSWGMQMSSILQIKMGMKMYEGNVTYEEGDLIEAVFSDKPEVRVGDQLRCLMTTHFETISNFEAVVIAKQENRVFFFHSPTVLEFREQRRRYPRFDMDRKGWIQYQTPDTTTRQLVPAQWVDLMNLSLGGLAFRSNKPIPADGELTFFVDLYGQNRPDGFVRAKLKVLHDKTEPPYYLYGCKITSIGSRSFLNLRKYILQRQLEERRQIRM